MENFSEVEVGVMLQQTIANLFIITVVVCCTKNKTFVFQQDY